MRTLWQPSTIILHNLIIRSCPFAHHEQCMRHTSTHPLIYMYVIYKSTYNHALDVYQSYTTRPLTVLLAVTTYNHAPILIILGAHVRSQLGHQHAPRWLNTHNIIILYQCTQHTWYIYSSIIHMYLAVSTHHAPIHILLGAHSSVIYTHLAASNAHNINVVYQCTHNTLTIHGTMQLIHLRVSRRSITCISFTCLIALGIHMQLVHASNTHRL